MKEAPGYSEYRAPDGALVIRLHHRADPAKQDEWRARVAAKYPGGEKNPRFRQEIDIDWYLHGKSPVFANWPEIEAAVFCEPFRVPQGWTIIGGYDYGYREPFSFSFLAFESAIKFYKIQELYARGLTPQEQAAMVLRSPYAPRLKYTIGDPSIWHMTQHQMTGNRGNNYKGKTTSIGDILRTAGLYVRPGNNDPGCDIAYKDLLLGHLWRDLKKPMYKIVTTCVNTREEYRQIQFKDYVSKQKAEATDLPEVLASRKTHAWDSDKYPILSRPFAMMRGEPAPPPNSIAALIAEIKSAKKAREEHTIR